MELLVFLGTDNLDDWCYRNEISKSSKFKVECLLSAKLQKLCEKFVRPQHKNGLQTVSESLRRVRRIMNMPSVGYIQSSQFERPNLSTSK
ncbi:hypothetical protein RB195_007866 [Necator americanus]|uniref:Uncharacterized protein n=1 Tax=Necator americanus TaxID=51031 RepID=A0ABR1BZA9_NECAM